MADGECSLQWIASTLLKQARYMHGRDLEFDDLVNCIRFAHKYQMIDIYEDLMGELKKMFPEDFEAWETHASLYWEIHDHSDAIVAVGLAVFTNTPSILPIALYLCCQLEGAHLLAGRMRNDHTVDSLGGADFVRCYDAKAKLCSRAFQVIPHVYGSLSNIRCTAPTQRCETVLETLHRSAIDGAALDDADILSSWLRHSRGSDSPLCPSCDNAFREREREIRKQVWAELPIILRLEGCWHPRHGKT